MSAGGYDTHSDQAEYHAYLMYELASSVKAFYDDLASVGKTENVLLMTISEFGRRVEENGSYGTDHGVSAPMMLFGDEVIGGLKGEPANLEDLDEYGNMKFSTDFRSVYTSVLKDWFCIDLGLAQAVMGHPFEPVANLLPACEATKGSNNLAALLGHNPDPTHPQVVNIKYAISTRGIVRLQILNPAGQTKATLVNAVQEARSYTIPFDRVAYGLPAGNYIYRLETGGRSFSRKIRVV